MFPKARMHAHMSKHTHEHTHTHTHEHTPTQEHTLFGKKVKLILINQ